MNTVYGRPEGLSGEQARLCGSCVACNLRHIKGKREGNARWRHDLYRLLTMMLLWTP